MAQEERDEEMSVETMDETDLRTIMREEIANALRSMDFSKQTKVTTITSGTLDEQISRSAKAMVKEALKEEMEAYRKDVESTTLPPPPQQMVPVSSMIPVQQSSGMKTWQKVTLGALAVLGTLAIGGAAYTMGKGSNDSGNFLDGDMPD